MERGALHERDYLEHLKSKGFSPTVIDGIAIEPSSVAKTLEAMKAGAPIIVQGALQGGALSILISVMEFSRDRCEAVLSVFTKADTQCPLMAQSGQAELHCTCPLSGVERT